MGTHTVKVQRPYGKGLVNDQRPPGKGSMYAW